MVYLSKSKYCKAKQCNKILWLDNNTPELAEKVDNETVFLNGNKVGNVAKGLFKECVTVPFSKDLNYMVEETKKHIQNGIMVIAEATFVYDKNYTILYMFFSFFNHIV